MKPQEAIETIKIALAEVEWEYPMDYAAAFENAIEALEKQESKTIYECIETRLNNKVRYDKFRCSVCGFVKEFADGHTAQYKYCPQCGQRIDWSDADAD